jgi:hypothetical protein
VLPPPSGERLHEVYFRPPANAMEPETLLAVLRRRLGISAGNPPEVDMSRGEEKARPVGAAQNRAGSTARGRG